MKRVIIFADQDVGLETVRFVLSSYRPSLVSVVRVAENQITSLARKAGCHTCIESQITSVNITELLPAADYIILAWWPKIIDKKFIDYPTIGLDV